jgi:hypothetical protein
MADTAAFHDAVARINPAKLTNLANMRAFLALFSQSKEISHCIYRLFALQVSTALFTHPWQLSHRDHM